LSDWSDRVAAKLRATLPGAEVEVEDVTGTGAHLEANVAAAQFAGRPVVEQRRLVEACLREELESGEVHTLSLRLRVLVTGDGGAS
jgi:stress-induced morphogen